MEIEGVLLDLAGVVYQGDESLPGAREGIERIRDAGLALRFATNTSRRTRAGIVQRLAGMNIPVEPTEIFTAPRAARRWLDARDLHPLLLIHEDLAPEFEDLQSGEPDAVFVGDAGTGFTYERLNAAFRVLAEGAPLVAVARNRYFREGEALSLDVGPFVAALEYAADTRAVIMGKPAAAFFAAAVEDMGLAPGRVLMAGDDVEADIIGARDAGLEAALVATGKYRVGDEACLEGTGAHLVSGMNELLNLIDIST